MFCECCVAFPYGARGFDCSSGLWSFLIILIFFLMIRPIWCLLITKNTGFNSFSARTLVLKLAPFSHSAFTQYSSYFQALIFQIYVTAKRLNFSGMFAACQHAYISPLKLNLCSNGMDHGTRHIQSCLLLHSPTNASMHDRCIRRYFKFRRLCLSPCFLD